MRLSGPTPIFDLKDLAERESDAEGEPVPDDDAERVGVRAADASASPRVLRVRVLAADGAPLVGETVWIGSDEQERTDAEGWATRADRALGAHDVACEPDGHFPMRGTAIVRAGTTTELTLREPVGARLRVEVVDPRGRPCPSARVEAVTRSGDPVLDLSDGVLRIDDFTDEQGLRTFARVRPGPVRLVVRWRGRTARTDLDAVDGETKDVRVVIR